MQTLMKGGLAALGFSLFGASAASAADIDLAKAFGAREIRQASLSPDGKSIALVQPLAEGQAYGLFIAKVDTPEGGLKPALSSSGNPDRLDRCGWVSNTRLICDVRYVTFAAGQRLSFTRVVAVNADGSKLQLLSAQTSPTAYTLGQNGGSVIDWLADDQNGAVLMTRAFAEEYSTGTLISNSKTGLGIERVETETLKRSLVEQPKADAAGFISDQHGEVRIFAQRGRNGAGYIRGRTAFLYRAEARGPWQPLSTYDEEADTGFRPVTVDKALNAAYGFENIEGRQAVVRISLDGALKREVIYRRDDVDVDELIRIGRQRRVVGVGYATDKRQAVFFDPALKSLAASLSRALPGQPQVRFVDASLDESRLLLWAGNDVDSGKYYLYDKASRQLRPLVEARPDLSSVKLAPVKPVNYKAGDGTMVPGYLTLPLGGGKNLPAIVMPHGGPGSRDEWGFDWLAQYFAARGYAVLQPNFRGSSGYGDEWFQENGFRSWKVAMGDVNDAAHWLVDQQIAAPGKLAIVGWSYGGYAALQTQVVDPDLFRAVVAIAPVTDLDALREEFRDFVSFNLVDRFIGRGPHITEGSPARNVEKIKAPVLMFHGEADDNVGVAESRLMLSRLKGAGKSADLIVFPGLDHQLDDAKARGDMLARTDAFLRKELGL